MAQDESDAIDTAAVTGIIGYRLRRAQLHVFQSFIERFADEDLRPADYSTLALIRDNPGRKQTEIAAVLGIKRANFVALVGGLDTRGLVERRARDGDRRSHALYLTADGEAAMRRLDAMQARFEADCIERLGGEAEAMAFLAMLDRLMGVGR